jgi:hypothetical protein
MSTKQHVRRVFQWLEQVNADKNLPSSAFKIAFVIAQHLNEETGEAWPSTETIGSYCALYPSSVRVMVDNLVKHGHLAVEWGRKGRGHPNKYRPILKPQQPAVLRSRRKPQPDETKPQPDDLKTAAGCHEPPKNHLNNHHQSAPPARSSVPVDRACLTETETTADDAPLNPAFGTADDAPISATERPVQRAAGAALTQPLAEQEQPPPCRASSEMGRAAYGAGGSGFGRIRMEFERVTREYPADRLGDKAAALLAFNAAVGERGVANVVDSIEYLLWERGEDVPDLADALAAIEHGE